MRALRKCVEPATTANITLVMRALPLLAPVSDSHSSLTSKPNPILQPGGFFLSFLFELGENNERDNRNQTAS